MKIRSSKSIDSLGVLETIDSAIKIVEPEIKVACINRIGWLSAADVVHACRYSAIPGCVVVGLQIVGPPIGDLILIARVVPEVILGRDELHVPCKREVRNIVGIRERGA
jgi:hypothetical protein